MADHCNICDTRRPNGGTNHLVLGSQWIEFCPICGETETLTNSETGETVTIAELFRRSGGTPTPVDPQRVANILKARKDAKERQEQAALKQAVREQARKAKLRGGLG